MKNKVYLVLDVFNYVFEIFDTAKKAWDCFSEWCKDYDKDGFNEIRNEALALFEIQDYYVFNSNFDDWFLISGAIVE